MALRILNQAPCPILFCEDEEIGGQGAWKFTRSGLAPGVSYIVEMDRRGHDGPVFYNCDNRDFVDYVTGFGFQEAFGSFSDISAAAPHLGAAAVNISARYYNEHQRHEHINLTHREHTISRILEMVQTPTEQFEYVERELYGSFGGQTCLWDRFSGSPGMRDSRKILMPVPETAYVEVNGRRVENGLAHFIDDKGTFSRRAAQKVTTLPLEEALARLNVG